MQILSVQTQCMFRGIFFSLKRRQLVRRIPAPGIYESIILKCTFHGRIKKDSFRHCADRIDSHVARMQQPMSVSNVMHLDNIFKEVEHFLRIERLIDPRSYWNKGLIPGF